MTANIDPHGNLSCDNYSQCENMVSPQGTLHQTLMHARARGWHVFDGYTVGLVKVFLVLCPECVGKRDSRPRPPANLPGQEELF